jgi:hypothetical protein
VIFLLIQKIFFFALKVFWKTKLKKRVFNEKFERKGKRMINKKEFGDWAVVFWKKGSKVLYIAQNQGDLGTTNYWKVGTTTRQFDYESEWLPNKEWTSAIKGYFSKDKAIQMAKNNAEKFLSESEFFRKGQVFEGKNGRLVIKKQVSPDSYLVDYSDFLLPFLSFIERTFSADELEEAIKKVQSGEQLIWNHFQSLKEDRFDKLEYLYVKGSYALIRKYEQGPFLKKILNGNVFDKLYRYVSAGKLKTKDNPFNVKNWKVGDDILLGLTSTLPFEDPKNLKKDLGVNFSYCMVFKDVKGYSVKYDAKDFTGYRGIEDYKWQKEVLTAGLFHVDNIEQKGKITYVELSTVKQDKETFIEILRKTREDLESGEFNKQYPTSLGVEYANYDVLEKELKDANLTIFNTNNLSQKDINAIKKLPKVNIYEDLFYFIKEYGLYEDLQPLCIKELPKEFTKEVWNNTLINMHLALPEETFPQNKDEAYDKWNCVRPQTKKWPKETGEYISFQNKLEGIWFIANKYFALKSIKEKLEKNSLNESKYVDKDIEPLGKKLSQHSDDGFIDFCTAKVLDDLNKGNKEKLDFFDFWDWAAEVGSKDIVELIYHDFKNDKLAKDSAVCKFYKIYEKIKDLSLKDPKKFIKLYGWAYKDKIKDKDLKKELKESHKKLPSYLAKYGATHFSELWEVVNCKDPIEEFNLTNEEEKKVYSEIEKLVKGINKENFKKNIKAVYDLGKKCGSNDALFQITPYAWEAICKKEGLDEKTGKSLKENKYRCFKMKAFQKI